MDESEAIELLHRTNGAEAKLVVIKLVEEEFRAPSYLLLYYLGVAYDSYCSWHLTRDRNPPLRVEFCQKAVSCLELAFEKSEGIIPDESPFHDPLLLVIADKEQMSYRSKKIRPDRIEIAGELGRLLVKESRCRDLQKARVYLKWVHQLSCESRHYYPASLLYAELLMREKEYRDALRICDETFEIAKNDRDWADRIPPGIENKKLAVLYRWADDELKSGTPEKVKEVFQMITALDGVISDDDLRKLAKRNISL